jgi:PAS domain S-box-containing protein
MTVLAAILSILAGACWFAAAMHLIVGLGQSFNRTHLAFALLAAFAGGNALSFVWLHQAPDVAHYVDAVSWAVLTGSLTLAALPWFVHFYTAERGRLIPLTLSALYVAMAVATALLPFGLIFDSAPRLVHLRLPWGEIAAVHDSQQFSPRVIGFWLLHACNFAYAYRACVMQYRRGQGRRAIALAVSTSIVMLAIVGNILISTAGLRSLYLTPFAFVALVLLMMFWLGSDERFRTLIAQATDGIFIADRRGRYIDVNAAGCALLGYTREELCRMHVFDIVMPQEVLSVEREKAALLTGHVVRGEWQFRRKDGSCFTGELSARMLSDGRLVGQLRDVTERQRLMRSLEERVAARTAEYAELNRQLESFSYSVSHDLRAPVRAIAGFSSVLLQDHADGLNEEGRRHLSRIQGAAGHMNELIEGLLQLAQVSHHTLQDGEVDLSKLAQEVIQRLREREPGRNVSFVCSPPLKVRGDGRLLRIVMHNLIENAWKYTSRTTDAHIEFGCASAPQGTTFFVKDNGAGFEMQFAEHLFQPFQRLHSATEFAGAGIGLATVARVVERHGGRVWARAAPGAGATFFFTLANPVTVTDTKSQATPSGTVVGKDIVETGAAG